MTGSGWIARGLAGAGPRTAGTCLLLAWLLGGCASSRPVAEVPMEAPPDSATIVFALRAPREVEPDSLCFHDATPWAAPQEVLLASPSRTLSLFDVVRWEEGPTPPGLAARDEVQRRLGLDALEFGASGVSLRKEYGSRLSLYTTTGLGAAAEDALDAEYQLWKSWYLRSETRERGESYMEFRREVSFR